VREEECLPATGGSQRVVSSGEEHAADPVPGVVRMTEEEEQLTVLRVSGGVTDDAFGCVDRDQEHIRRQMVGDELIPVLRREHRLGDQLAEVGPAGADRRVEDRPDR